ncbi:hypothetical protein TW95_gp1588 [Pandoravirus inopinatum]|uniref:Uncharacterized protein n=1 Tax=Pandoravirus inopinatum TaxID=1605721 RepID=A0A0B5JEU6_9VIRU|nr:hypothetical protein TW95_gp1588 [Pandoravirus inopinatum]AJF98322.1 hypothetical protein [Pandoravirus inopinatum]
MRGPRTSMVNPKVGSTEITDSRRFGRHALDGATRGPGTSGAASTRSFLARRFTGAPAVRFDGLVVITNVTIVTIVTIVTMLKITILVGGDDDNDNRAGSRPW